MCRLRLSLILLLALALTPLTAAQDGPGTPETPEAALAWTRVGVHGFGVSSNDTVWSLASYKGQLYAGTRNPSLGAQVWRSADGATWKLAKSGGLGDLHNTAIPSMAASDRSDYLYLGTENSADGAEVWSTDGTTWTQINANGFYEDDNDVAWSMTLNYSNRLYVGTLNNAHGANVWQYEEPNWKYLSNGLSAGADTIATAVLVSSSGDVTVGTWDSSMGGQVLSCNPSTGIWTDLKPPWSKQNLSARSMIYFQDALYAGTFNSAAGAQIWRYINNAWDLKVADGFGDRNNVGISSLFVFGDTLYVGTENNLTGAEVWRSKDGENWNQVNKDGFGSPGNNEATSMAGLGPYLFVGTRNSASGGEVWRVNLLGADQSFLINRPTNSAFDLEAVYNSRDREYLVAWRNSLPGYYNDDLQAERMTWDGHPVSEAFPIAGGAGAERRYPTAAYDPVRDRYLVAWYSNSSTGWRISARLFLAGGSPVLGEFNLYEGHDNPVEHDVIYWPEADRYLSAYTMYEHAGTQGAVWVQLVTSSGVIDGPPLEVHRSTAELFNIALAYNSQRGEVMLVWVEAPNIYGMRATWTAGKPSWSAPFVIGQGRRPSIAALDVPAGSGQYLVAWNQLKNIPWLWYEEIRVLGITGEGNLLGGPLAIGGDYTSDPLTPAVIGLPVSRRYQVVWLDQSDGYGNFLFSQAVSSGGSALGSPGWIAGSRVTSHALVRGPGDSYLVAYSEPPLGSAIAQVRGRLFGVKKVFLPIMRK